MSTSNTLLHDTGRFPLWLRIPLSLFGLLMLWLGAAIAAHGLFGISLGIDMTKTQGSPLLGSLACFVLAALFIFIWFGQVQVLFDEARQELVVRSGSYFRVRERRTSLAGASEIHLLQVQTGVFARGTAWVVAVKFLDGRSVYVTRISYGIDPFAQSLEAATKLPVKRLSGELPLDQMTNLQIFFPTVIGTLICGFMIVMNFRLLIIGGNWFSITGGAIGTTIVMVVLVGILSPAIREFRRRRNTSKGAGKP